jgi:hypothetical protein
MIFNKKYGLLGLFQLPLNIFGVPLLALAMSLILYNLTVNVTQFFTRTITIDGYFWNHFVKLPNLQDFLILQDVRILLPVGIGMFLWVISLVLSHKHINRKVKPSTSIISYLFIHPVLTALQWFGALFKEVTRMKKVWR